MDSKELEKEIQEKGLNAPRLTPDLIQSKIAKEEYNLIDGSCLTICILTLCNGFTVTGESSCVSPENFDPEIGRKVARANAVDKIWPLEGYLLKEMIRRSEDEFTNVCNQVQSAILFNKDKVEVIAKTCHEVNRAYCMSIGDFSQPEWRDAPEWQKNSAIAGVNYHLENDAVTPEQSHESWLKVKIDDGWTYGEQKNPELKQHPCCVPYGDLPVEQKAKDYLFKSVIESLK